jgi:hypothetical protein
MLVPTMVVLMPAELTEVRLLVAMTSVLYPTTLLVTLVLLLVETLGEAAVAVVVRGKVLSIDLLTCLLFLALAWLRTSWRGL